MQPTLLAVALAVAVAGSTESPIAATPGDPVSAFLVEADSAGKSSGDALAALVRAKSLLVGAAVGALLDEAFDASDRAMADDHLVLARRIAELHRENSGSDIPLTIVDTFESWTDAQRATRREAIALEAQAVTARDLGALDRAVELFEQARALYESIGDRRSVAVNHGSLGIVHWHRDDMAMVYKHYEQALEARRAVEDRILEGRTLNGLGSANYRVGNYQRAIEWYEQAAALREQTGDRSGLGTSLTYMGNAYYQMGRLPQARDYFERAVTVLEDIGDAEQTFDVLNGMASIYSDVGRLAAANGTFRRAIDVAHGAGLVPREIMARRNLADNLRLMSRFGDAVDQLDAVEALLADHPGDDERALLLRDRGTTYMNMGDVDAARDDLVGYLKLAKTLGNPAREVEALINVGYLYRELDAFDRALATAEKARELAASVGDERNQRLALALSGACAQATGDYAAALSHWQAALSIDEALGAEQMVLADRASIAGVKAEMGRTAEARREFRSLLPAVRDMDFSVVSWAVRFGLGHTFEEENADSAAAYYEDGLAMIERAGATIGAEEVQTGYLSGRRRFYYEEVGRYYATRHAREPDAGWSRRAFATMERAKARGLVQLLEKSVAGLGSPEEDDVLEAMYALDESAADYATRRRELERRYAELRAARVDSAFGGLGRDRTRIAAIDDVARALPEHAALLEYALGDTTSLLWAIDAAGHELVLLPPRRVIEREVGRLRDALTRPGAGDEALRGSARSLYEMLVAPAQSWLDRAADVVIVPDGALFELPFELLLTEPVAEGAAWSDLAFLARRNTVTYAPSATVFTGMDADAPGDVSYDLDLLAVANPDFTGLDALAPLPFAEDEVKNISALVDRDRRAVLVGGEASESAYKRRMANGTPRVLHLATHGLVDPFEPTRSSVVLASDPAAGDDGYLHTLEILSTPAPVGLVVMSACESARGKVSRGEGVVGLSRAFIASGARAVVASLWAVSDESTAELMKTLYENMMGEKEPAGRALNQARLAMIEGERFAHPFYWSPFVVIGDGGAPW